MKKLLTILLASILAIACQSNSSGPKLGFLAGNGAGPFTPSQAAKVTPWFLDEQNSVAGGCASDANTCTSATCTTPNTGPCATFDGIASKWATYNPALQQTTTINILSDVTSSENIVVGPYMNTLTFQGASGVTTLCTSTIDVGTTVAKSASTNTRLQVGLSGCAANVAAGAIIQNTTHASFAYVNSLVAGNTWNMSQPVANATFGAEVDTWADGDSYNVLKYPQIRASFTGSFTGDSKNVNFNQLDIEGNSIRSFGVTSFFGCKIGTNVMFTGGQQNNVNYFNNDTVGSVKILPPSIMIVTAGQNRGSMQGTIQTSNDFMSTSASGMTFFGGSMSKMWSFNSPINIIAGPNYTTIATSWSGSGSSINVQDGGNLVYSGDPTTVFFTTTPLSINGQTTACSHTQAAPDVVNCGITVNAANLKAAAGAAGFGGLADSLFGSHIMNMGN